MLDVRPRGPHPDRGLDASSRIYRITVHGDGDAEIGEQVGGDYEGVIKDLAVSPRGRIAYSRAVGKRDDPLEIGRTFVGLMDDHREWSAAGGQGFGAFGDGELGLHWRDLNTLVFRGPSPKTGSPLWTFAAQAVTCRPPGRP